MKSLLLATAAFVGITSFGYGSSGSDGVSEGEERPAKRIKVEGPNAPLSQIGQSVFSGIKNDNVIEKILGMVRSEDRTALRTANRATVYDVDRLGPVNIKLLGKPEDLEMIFIHGGDGQGGLRHNISITGGTWHFLELSDEDQLQMLPYMRFTRVDTNTWEELTDDQKESLRGHVVEYQRYQHDSRTPVQVLEYFTNLTKLNLEFNMINDRDVARLAASNSLLKLTELCLAINDFSDDAIIALAASPGIRNLKKLDLDHCSEFGLRGAMALANSPNLPNLKTLVIYYHTIDDSGIGALANSPNLPRLTNLVIRLDELAEEEEALNLMLVLNENTTLRDLSLLGGDFSSDFEERLKEWARNKRIHLYLA